ncbi:MAG: DUF6236 family protein [Photobacterium frigidiphilum]|uniref:DUF6236 family protein n=1 Tax=Photobacterium frigidiphilum TaxID=264736 RepID=UPI003001FA19
MHKGLVIGPQFSGDATSLSIESSQPDPVSLRKYLLLWDTLDFPDNNIISFGLDDDMELLHQEGILKRTRININGSVSVGAKFYSTLQHHALNTNNNNVNEEWELAQSSNGTFQAPQFAISRPAIEFDLYNSLSIPTKDVPIHEVLEFKHRREDLLIELRDSIDDITSKILMSDHIEKSKTKEIKKLHRNLNQLSRTLSESKIDKIKSSLKSYISHLLVSAAGVFSLVDIPPQFEPYRAQLNVAALGVAGVSVAVKGFCSSPQLPEHLNKYAYVSYAQRELKPQ